MKEPISQLSKLKPKNINSIDSSWVDLWNQEIKNREFCLITFYNIKEYLNKSDLNWCKILVAEVLPTKIGENLCDLVKINVEKYNNCDQDVLTEMEIYRELSKEYIPKIDRMYEIILQAKENGKFNTHS